MIRTRIKICGTTSGHDAVLAHDAGADAIGLIFARSRRQVDAATARRISLAVGQAVGRVGVFVLGEANAGLDELLRTADAARLTAVQLHGPCSDLYLQSVLRYYPVLQVVRAGDPLPQPQSGLSILYDAPQPGSGQALDWQSLREGFVAGSWLAGGLGPHNVAEALRTLPAGGVDAVSALEASPGVKDPQKVRAFTQMVFDTDRQKIHEKNE